MRVLITDCDYKHSIALQRYIRLALPEVQLVAHSTSVIRYARYYAHCREYLEGMPLIDAISLSGPDMVIPVGAASVQAVRYLASDRVVLPSAESLDRASDKGHATALASSVGILVPRTFRIQSSSDAAHVDLGFPCVVKPANELDGKFVRYPRNQLELEVTIENGLRQLGTGSGGLLVQQYVSGPGAGFFALYEGGALRRVFMHRRIREWPSTGGASTAARAIRDKRLLKAGTAILDALEWNGVAMVEFKVSGKSGDYVFVEVNGKFWGSCELALAAGVNFGADLIRLYRGERLEYDDNYKDSLHFYWPLDGDLLSIASRREFGSMREYFRANAQTNLGQSIRAEAIKALAMMVKLVRFALRRP